ncbi:hypothetical protein PVAND_011892 [Polypedilum vanderplanki]|uniref:Arrestin C-terminal-like domain-containing protein n=1 Tax=Polypedilum vanderplanki TaxID=319348 RepID=A0A9J6CJY8_POLVA|nr:hypothetical protein PVAND_011892 [Polypedilum vanderplanki]
MQCNLHFVNSFVNFVNRERVCSPGDNVKVTIDFHFKQPTKIEEVHLNVIGIAKTKFMKQTPAGNGKLLSDSCELLNKRIEVFKDAQLSSGLHKFRSSFFLPQNLPSSFKFRNNATSRLMRWKKTGCMINYKIQIVVLRPNSPVKRYEFPFEVIRSIDLNEFVPNLLKPREIKLSNMNGIAKDFSLTASIPQRGYVPGDDIVVSLNVVNNSEVLIKEIDVLLIKKIVLACVINKDPIEKDEEEWIVTEAVVNENDEIRPNESKLIKKVIKVPKLQPIIDNCDLIQVCYRLWIRVKTNEIGKRETLVIPIVIGTIGFKNENNISVNGDDKENIAKKKPNLSLNFENIKNNNSTDVCTCTCSCSHCSKIKVIDGMDLKSPESGLSTPNIPETPMSPTTSMSFCNNDETIEEQEIK